MKCWVAVVTNESLLGGVELVVVGDGGVGRGQNETVIQSLEVDGIRNAVGNATSLIAHGQQSRGVRVVTHGSRLADSGVQLRIFEDHSNVILAGGWLVAGVRTGVVVFPIGNIISAIDGQSDFSVIRATVVDVIKLSTSVVLRGEIGEETTCEVDSIDHC